MNRLKDIIYDKNDILIALIIVLLAGLLIHNRIEVIMDYPSVLAAETSIEVSEENPAPIENENPPVTEGSSETEEPAETENPVAEQTAGEPTVSQVSIYIEYGATGSQIAQILIDSGLIESSSQFYSAVEAAGADTKLQAGSFKIPSNATPAEIIRIITN